MAIYEYRCPGCDKKFEVFAKMKNFRRRKKCPECGQRAELLVSMPNLVTDTNFCVAGVHHVGVCDPENPRDVVVDRADWSKRLEKKGLRELDKAELQNPKAPKPQPCM